MFYNVYSERLKEKYGEKVYKLPVNLPVSCPNRDNTTNRGGCFYCGSKGTGFESLPSSMNVKQQLLSNMDYIGKKYNAKKFIAYFQNFSNTYMPLPDFKNAVNEAVLPNIIGIDISTRPDCIAEEYLRILGELENIDIGIELGLQSVNFHTLESINRGHTLAEFIDSVQIIKKFGFNICVHMILDLPQDDMTDVIEGAKILSALKINSVKLHSLYISKGSEYEKLYTEGKLKLLTSDDYIERCAAFLRHLSPEIAVQRLIGRAPQEDSIIANFNMSWWKIKDLIEEKMENLNAVQGDLCNYLGGKAVKQFIK